MLELDNLHKRFDAAVALDGCSFRVERGRVLGFLGRNGAGKTTAMRSIFGLVRLDAGAVRWEGQPVQRETRFGFGYMPEERGLYPRMRVRDQLEYFGRLRSMSAVDARREADRWLGRLDLADRATTSVDSLSHGNQQKVQLAVSLIGDPGLLVLDEPFSGLDPIAADVLSEVIRDTAERGAAVVFSSHQLDLVGGVCDDIAIITHGKVVLTGDLAEVRRASPVRHLDLSITASGDPAWPDRVADALPGARILSRNGAEAQFSVRAELALQEIVAAVEPVGQFDAFRLEPPSLEDIFRDVAGEPV